MLVHSVIVFLLLPNAVILTIQEPFTTLTAISVSAGVIISKNVYCRFYECCNDRWIPRDARSLKSTLKSRIFGQPQVADISALITGHLLGNPSKPLVLSIHGPSGTGKNYVSQIVSELLFRAGINSKFRKLIIGSHLAAHNADGLQKKLHEGISEVVAGCHRRSLIIIDEADKLPTRILDSLKPLMDHHESVDGVDYRNTIFLLLSNSGQERIANLALETAAKGLPRESIPILETEKMLRSFLYNNNDSKSAGFFQSSLISSSIIDYYIVFYPLEKVHVKQCIKHEARKRSINDVEACVEIVIAKIEFIPPSSMHFSASGCKKIRTYVDAFC